MPGFVSFIIPTYNEEFFISDTIDSIHRHNIDIDYEIIVSDNGSIDRTRDISTERGCVVINHPNISIAALRNKGRAISNGDILVFLDADVHITQKWQTNSSATFKLILEKLDLITGSRCLPPDNQGWFNKFWFCRLGDYDSSYVNSGHLITSSFLFDKLGGFNEELVTSEDYDFCKRALRIGASVQNDNSIPVIHFGYPENLRDYIKRERWHGRSDFDNFITVLNSKVALISILNLVLLIVTLALFLLKGSVFLLFYPFCISVIAIALTLIKFRFRSLSYCINTSVIFFFYIWGRSLAFFDRLLHSGMRIVGHRKST